MAVKKCRNLININIHNSICSSYMKQCRNCDMFVPHRRVYLVEQVEQFRRAQCIINH